MIANPNPRNKFRNITEFSHISKFASRKIISDPQEIYAIYTVWKDGNMPSPWKFHKTQNFSKTIPKPRSENT
jgi:hypothetical protein